MELVLDGISDQDATALNQLVSQYSSPGMIVIELGTYTGKSSLAMLPGIKNVNGRLYCVDWFKGMVNTIDAVHKSYKENNILDVFLERIKNQGYEKNVVTIVGTTDHVSRIIGDQCADIIFIDADHRYSNVRRDIINWYPKLKKGGLICGHDFEEHLKDCNYLRVLEKCDEGMDLYKGVYHYGVIRSVCEFFPDVSKDSQIWYIQNKDDFFLLEQMVELNKIKNMVSRKLVAVESANKKKIEIADQLKEFVSTNSHNENLVLAVCSNLWREDFITESLNILEEILSQEKATQYAKVKTLYAHYLFLLGKKELSLNLFNELIQVNEDDPVLLNKIGESYFSLGDLEKAKIYFQKALDLSVGQHFPEVVNNIGVYYWEKGQKENALSVIKSGVEMTSAANVNLIVNYSRMLTELGQKEKALSILEQLQTISEDDRIAEELIRLRQA